jgi:hypothetical protein
MEPVGHVGGLGKRDALESSPRRDRYGHLKDLGRVPVRRSSILLEMVWTVERNVVNTAQDMQRTADTHVRMSPQFRIGHFHQFLPATGKDLAIDSTR